MLADYYMPIILLISIFLLLFLSYKFQKKTIPLPDETCSWSEDHWLTNTCIRVSRLNEVTSAKLPDTNSTFTLQDWLIDTLGRPIKPNDVVNFGDLKFLITHYRDRRHNKVRIYPSTD